ncbi:MAG: hypothetical protein P4L67_03605 [Candidatus Pacebacteria bacterium]|nr:hypothetical protein [Candidatus Paceibacterota bacterium]
MLPPKVFKQLASTAKPIVHISQVTRVQRSGKFPNKFVICYAEEGKEIVFDYEAKNAREAAEIVVRVKYIIVSSHAKAG